MQSDTNELAYTCPACGKAYRVTPANAGKKVRCKCGNVGIIPAIESDGALEIVDDRPTDDFSLKPIAKAPPAAVTTTSPAANFAQTQATRATAHKDAHNAETRQMRRLYDLSVIFLLAQVFGSVIVFPIIAAIFVGMGESGAVLAVAVGLGWYYFGFSACYCSAQTKGHSGLWALGGIIPMGIGFIVVALLPDWNADYRGHRGMFSFRWNPPLG